MSQKYLQKVGAKMAEPIDFKQSNMWLSVCEEHKKLGAESMHAAHIQYENGINAILECWKLSWKERLSVLFFGKVWLSIWTMPDHVPPVYIAGEREFIKVSKKGKQ